MQPLIEELYTVSISPCGKTVAFGGKSEIIHLHSFPDLAPITQTENLSDSIIFLRFITSDIIISATLNGILSLFIYENSALTEATNIDLEEDIVFCDVQSDTFLVGTEKGTIHAFSLDLSEETMFVGQYGDIRALKFYNDRLYSLSSDRFVIFDVTTQEVLFKRTLIDFRSLDIINDSIIFVGGDEESMLIKDKLEVVNKFMFGAEATLLTENRLIVGGHGCSLHILMRNSPSSVYSLRFLAEKVTGFSKIVRFGEFGIVLSTFCGKIGVGDIRSFESFKYQSADVGIIYDIQLHNGDVVCVGEHGIRNIRIVN